MNRWRSFAMAVLIAMVIFLPAPGTWAQGRDPLEPVGDAGQVVLPAAALIMTYAHGDDDGTAQFIKAFALAQFVTGALKLTIDSRRPNGGEFSFPSGHTASAFAGAAFLHRRYGWRYGGPAYMLATVVGISRITSNNHWPGDVLAGAVIGIGTNWLITSEYQPRDAAIAPAVIGESPGLAIALAF